MTRIDSLLEPSFEDLDDALNDFHRSRFQNAENALRRMISVLNSEPLAGFLGSVLPDGSFAEWWRKAEDSRGGMEGSGALNWPIDRAERVSIQIELCRRCANEEIDLFNFIHDFCYVGVNDLNLHIGEFASSILDPMVRDIHRLAETRALPPVLLEAMKQVPTSGDRTLDGLISDAIQKFRDPAPKAHREAVERLWDAWERLKSLDEESNKKVSVGLLLSRAAPPGPVRELLENEATTLTEIGNQFHIRHFESDRSELARPEYIDYLFHRLYAMMHLLLFAGKDRE
ncbi:MAG: hypothetical protein U5R46_15290 [Gammaproteobacteria bacterium]|nr:hypothetical protein [Gammaproteobacteria bacterium]